MATQAKGRKIGNKKKVPSQKRYTGEMRWVVHKRKKVEKADAQAKAKKTMAIPRGSARRIRRGNLTDLNGII